MKTIKYVLIGFMVLNLVGCVSQKKFLELEDEFGSLQRVNTQLNRKLDDCNSEKQPWKMNSPIPKIELRF